MSRTAADTLTRSGATLSVRIMDIIRRQHAAGEQITAHSITREILQQDKLGPNMRELMRNRIARIVRQLEDSGMIKRTPQWNAKLEVQQKLITPCSAP